jgi:hypothetical protein
MEFPDFRSVQTGSHRPTRPLPVRPCMRQTGPRSFPQNLPFELSENGEQTGHGAPGRRGQIQRLSQGDETDTKMIQLLKCGQ